MRRQRLEGERTIGKGVSTINIEKILLNKKQCQTTLFPHIWKNKGTEMAYSVSSGPHHFNKVACGIAFKLWV